MSKRLIVVDISNFIFRAFFAIRPMNAPDGTPTNALYGTLTMILKLINAYQPSHIILARDTKGGSFRNQLYDQYKANRSEPPEELIPQFGLIEELIVKLQIPHFALENYEADDIIGSVVTQFQDQFDEVLIASGDKDLMQFVNDKVKMLDTMKDKTYGREEVYEKMGVYPEQIMDYLSLLGDSSDNIPGVKGIGAKGASKLLEEFKTLDNILENVDKITNKRAKTALETGGESAHLSRSLVKIVTDINLGMSFNSLAFELNPSEDLLEFLERVNFKSIKAKIGTGKALNFTPQKRVFIDYDVIKSKDKWDDALKKVQEYDQVYLESFYPDLSYHNCNSKYLTVATPEKTFVCYCDEISSYSDMIHDLYTKCFDIKLCSNHIKSIVIALADKVDISKERFFDLTQAHFLLDPDLKHDLKTIVMEFLSETVGSHQELAKESLEGQDSINNFEMGLARRGYWAIRAYPWLLKKMQSSDVLKVYSELDLPLEALLARMEKEGIRLDVKYYDEVEKDYQKQADEIEKEIKKLAGDEINIRSPKQLGVLLFDKLGLPVIKKTKTGYSTDQSVLEELANMNVHEVPALILKFRELDKLLSTYVKTLPKLVEDNKIHTHFLQYVAATGRLSSENPNLQNIPIKTENGRKLRKGFVAEKGHFLLGADYSQVELRILAHFSQDEVMVNAFKADEDIHRQTAAEIFNTPLEKITGEQRNYAKAINFGLMYGQSSFGLAQTLGISRTEAKDYITKYFTRFNKVKSYLDSLKEQCEKTGYSETLFGRKRIIRDINSTNRQTKSMAERMAINSPIQGTAADIIKKAMLSIDQKISEQKLKSKMILQVHDELIFDVPEDEVEKMKILVKTEMESVVDFTIPLKVDMGVAENWYDLK